MPIKAKVPAKVTIDRGVFDGVIDEVLAATTDMVDDLVAGAIGWEPHLRRAVIRVLRRRRARLMDA